MSDAIVLSNIGLAPASSGTAMLSAVVRGARGEFPDRMWFEIPAALGDTIGTTGDAFLPALLIRAMRDARCLVIEGPLSAALLERMPGLMATLASGDRRAVDGLRPVRVEADVQTRVIRGRAVASMFSGGVDSLYAVVRNSARYPPSDSRHITHLLLLHGFDIPEANHALFEGIREAIGRMADRLGKTLVPIRTNVRAFVRDVDWDRVGYGPCLVSTALALSPLVNTCYLSGAYASWEVHEASCHPLLDSLWSTDSTEFVHVGGEASRADRVAYLARFPDALQELRVCWKNPAGAYNCGQCEKCLRTMVELQVADALRFATQLPQRIDPDHIARLDLRPSAAPFWEESVARFRSLGRDEELARAIEHALLRRRWNQTLMAELDARIWTTMGRFGLTPRRAKAMDRYVLGGAATGAFRSLQSWMGRRERR